MEAPKKIYLQVKDDEGNDLFDVGEVTWCSDCIHETDVAYVRLDFIEKMISETSSVK